MGKYSDHLSKRINTWGPKEGYCAICRKPAKLTREHVPPASCGNVSKVVVRSLSNSGEYDKRYATTSQGGLNYRTTCSSCNNDWLGQKYDPALAELFNEVKLLAESVSNGNLSLPPCKTYFIKPQRIARSVIGHILAGNAVDIVKQDTPHAPMYQVMENYFFDETSALPEELEIFYWFYPFNDIRVARAFGSKFGAAKPIVGDLLKFFPFAFWVTWNQPKDINFNHGKLLPIRDLSIDESSQLTINFDSYPPRHFPEAPQDNGMTVFNSKMVAVGTK
ncbi:hypothetical protein OH456_06580 [Vibrio sp. La 4.2.2]|uniref:hypothetical protein n=1 Tax=Vibrio sp. La 4.2.2 TaxID=2998830 RepID=UPI0022CDFB7F|nr:hypothetical protein [Vibrio sp. La 4.2.2]MDA0107801.1 hypothetical protein [Vibrio sp. La 4.2.2]